MNKYKKVRNGLKAVGMHLQKVFSHIHEHGTAALQQAVKAAGAVTKQAVPQSHTVWEGEFLCEQ